MVNFSNLGLKKEIVIALDRIKLHNALEVQAKIIPLSLQGKNIVFTSPTGSGKTLAYSLGAISKINKKLETQLMIIVPTRELAIQVGKELKKICDILGYNVGTLYGGRDLSGDKRTLHKKNHIIVGTPGRLIQHINTKALRVGDVRFLVYDESDQMFDHGFFDDCKYIKTRVSKDSQIILASATITDKVDKFINREINNPEMLSIGSQIPSTIKQEKIFCEILKKNEIILNVLSNRKFKRAMIFCNTKSKTQGIHDFLKYNKHSVKLISGSLEQKDRENYLNLFKQGKVKILVTTDVAARGLHIENVDLVINYDAPNRQEFYVHRIGRSGRKGAEGYALSLVCPEDEVRFKKIEFAYDLDVSEIKY